MQGWHTREFQKLVVELQELASDTTCWDTRKKSTTSETTSLRSANLAPDVAHTPAVTMQAWHLSEFQGLVELQESACILQDLPSPFMF